MRTTTPSPTVFELVSRIRFLSLVSPKRRFPAPRTTGNTIRRSSSTRSCSISVCTSWALPWTTMSPSNTCLSFETSVATSPLSTVELFHSAFSRVEETTYLGMLLNLSAKSFFADGQAAAKPSYVTRPSSSASLLRVSSSLNLSPSCPRSILKVQPACLKPTPPPGASITPSSETNSVTTILPILILLHAVFSRPRPLALGKVIGQASLVVFLLACPTVELTRRRESKHPSPHRASCETRSRRSRPNC